MEGQTHYPPGIDGREIMRLTAEGMQSALRDFCMMGDITVSAIDDDSLTVTMPGMAARYLLTRMRDAGLM